MGPQVRPPFAPFSATIHACASVCSLRQVDLELMKRLHRKVNIVIVIAKADTLTASEVAKLKKNILNDIKDNDIQVIPV